MTAALLRRLPTTTFKRRNAALSLLLAAAFGAQADSHVAPPADAVYPGTIVLNVDATNTAQQIFSMHETIPAAPGKLTLLFPQWVPGNHGPSAPLNQFAGLKLTANGQPLEWHRDPADVYAFNIDVPAGASAVEAEYQFLSPTEANQGRNTMTNDILGVQWYAVALYPAGYPTRHINFQANLKLPQGWQFGTALETAAQHGDEVAFKPIDMEAMVDSPVFAGRYFRRIDLDPGAKVPVHLDIVADNAEALEATPEQIAPHRALVQQAYKLYKSQHYAHYDFLFALSDEFGGIGRRPIGWSNWQRSEDYYSEGALIWLAADTKIRELSGDKHSLNDFAASFFGVDNGVAVAYHYTFEDVVKALNAVQPYDWASFLRTRLDGHGPGAPLDGLARSGWKLVYDDKQSEFLKGAEEQRKTASFQYSLGFSVGSEDKITALEWQGPGFKAGLSMGTTLLAVNGHAYKDKLLRAAVTAAAKDPKATIELLVKKGTLYRTITLDYHGGLKYPHLERIAGTPDRLSAILAPMK